MMKNEKESFEFLEHTADIKIRCKAKTLEKSFEIAAEALSNYLSQERPVKAKKVKEIKITGNDYNSLLYKFIEEILYLIDAERFIVSKAKVALKKSILTARIYGDNSSKYNIQQIKSPTYAEMSIKKSEQNWLVEFVIDV